MSPQRSPRSAACGLLAFAALLQVCARVPPRLPWPSEGGDRSLVVSSAGERGGLAETGAVATGASRGSLVSSRGIVPGGKEFVRLRGRLFDDNSEEDHQFSIVASFLVRIWPFLIWEGTAIVIATFVWTVYWVLKPEVSPFQVLCARMQMLTVILMLCPLLRAALVANRGGIHWTLLLRSAAEMEIFGLVFIAIPKMALSHTRRCASVAASAPVSTKVAAELAVTEATASKLLGRVQSGSMMVYACMMLRVGICAARAITFTFVLSVEEETLLIKLAANCAGLALLLAAAPLAFSRLSLPASEAPDNGPRDLRGLLSEAWGCRPQLLGFSTAGCSLAVIAQLQDVFFLILAGSERMAQIYAACLHIHEVAACAVFVCFYLASDHMSHAWSTFALKLPAATRLLLLCRPPIVCSLIDAEPYKDMLTSQEVSDCSKLLCRNVSASERRAGEHRPCWKMTESEEVGARSSPPTVMRKTIWRGVVFDAFTPFVRSRAMPVVMLTCMLNAIYYLYPAINAACNGLSDNSSVNSFALTVSLISVAVVLWFLGGVMLIGNNVFVSRSWLWLAGVAFTMQTAWHLWMFGHMTGMEKSLFELAHIWQHFFVACVGLYGCFLALRAFFEAEGRGDYHRGEKEAIEYTQDLLGPAPRAVHRMLHAAYDYPPMLLAGALATAPVILSLTYFTLKVGQTLLHYAKLAQIFALAAQGEVDYGDVFDAVDINYDGQLAASELGVSSLLYFLGMPELTNAVAHLWKSADLNGDNRLDVSEARRFLRHLFAVKAAILSWKEADATLAAQQLVVALDGDDSGALSPAELPADDLATMLRTTSPELSRGLRPEIRSIWTEADINGDGELDANELPALITALKGRIGQLQLAVRSACQELVREAATIFSRSKHAIAESVSATGRAAGAAADRAVRAWKENQETLRKVENEPPSSEWAKAVAERLWRLLSQSAAGSFAAAKAVLVASLRILTPELAAKANASIRLPPQNHTNRTDSSEQHSVLLAMPLLFPEALPEVVTQAMPKIRDGVARALLLLDLLEMPPEDSAPIVVKALDTDGDGRVHEKELGLEYVLGLVSPGLASWANDLVDSNGESGTLGESETAFVLRSLQALLRQYVGDLDGDGAVTRRDLARALRAAVADLFAGSEEAMDEETIGETPPAPAPAGAFLEFHSVSPGAPAPAMALELMHGVATGALVQVHQVRPAPSVAFAALRARYASRANPFAALTAGATDADLGSALSDLATSFVRWVAGLNIRRVELCFYTSALLSMAFGFYVVYNTFEAYSSIFMLRMRGDQSFRAHEVLEGYINKPDMSTFYPGMIFSTVLMGMSMLFPILFVVLIVVTCRGFWRMLWNLAAPAIIWIGATFLISYVVLRLVLLDWCCMKDGHVVRPRLFSCIYIVLTLVNFPLSGLVAITRFLTILPYAFLKFHQLDRSILQHSHWHWDFGTVSFLTTVGLSFEHLNPVRRAFVRQLNPGVHRLYGNVPAEEPESRAYPEPRDFKAKGYLKTARNRWWLLKLLAENPSLAASRRRQQPGAAV